MSLIDYEQEMQKDYERFLSENYYSKKFFQRLLIKKVSRRTFCMVWSAGYTLAVKKYFGTMTK